MEQREIKFRAWHKKENCFLDWLCIRQTAFNRSTEQGEYGLMYKVFTDYGADQFVLQQYTGLKDGKGKDIYEGDLITLRGKYLYEVKFEDGKFICDHVIKEYGRWGDLKRMSDMDFKQYGHEVIGNIFENPELIQPEKVNS